MSCHILVVNNIKLKRIYAHKSKLYPHKADKSKDYFTITTNLTKTSQLVTIVILLLKWASFPLPHMMQQTFLSVFLVTVEN